MNDLENKLENQLLEMKVPTIEEDDYQQILRNKLVRRYHSTESRYIKKFRYSVAFACFMVVLFVTVILFPEISIKANQVAFNNDVPTEQSYENADYSDDEFFKRFAEGDDNFYYTSIHNPNLKNRVDPEKYKEDKTYIIRKYVSQDSQAVMIISEFGKSARQKQLREVSF